MDGVRGCRSGDPFGGNTDRSPGNPAPYQDWVQGLVPGRRRPLRSVLFQPFNQFQQHITMTNVFTAKTCQRFSFQTQHTISKPLIPITPINTIFPIFQHHFNATTIFPNNKRITKNTSTTDIDRPFQRYSLHEQHPFHYPFQTNHLMRFPQRGGTRRARPSEQNGTFKLPWFKRRFACLARVGGDPATVGALVVLFRLASESRRASAPPIEAALDPPQRLSEPQCHSAMG